MQRILWSNLWKCEGVELSHSLAKFNAFLGRKWQTKEKKHHKFHENRLNVLSSLCKPMVALTPYKIMFNSFEYRSR